MLFGERILAIALSNQPTPGAWLTCDLERAEDSYKLCLRAGKAQDTWPKRRWGNKRQCQMPAHPPIAPPPLATFGKPSGCGCGSSVPGQAMPRLQDTASPFNASPPAPPAKAAHSQPAASRVTGEATDSPKGVMNAFLWPLPAHRHTSAHICPAARAACTVGHAGMPWGHKHGEGAPLTYFSYSALSRSQRESLCFCQSLPCLQVVRRTTSSPLWT